MRVAGSLVRSEQLEAAINQYQKWSDSLPAPTSTINHRLYFLELLEQAAQNNELKENEALATALLEGSGIRGVGDHFERVGRNGEKKVWKVIWRKIGSRYGIDMGLRSEDGGRADPLAQFPLHPLGCGRLAALRTGAVIAGMIGKLAGAALAGMKVPAHCRGSAMVDGPDGAPLCLAQRGFSTQEGGQEAAQHVDDGGGHAV